MEQDTSQKEKFKYSDCDVIEEEVCEVCGGTGEVEKMEHVTGDNIVPGGYYEGSGEFEPCECQDK